MSDREFTTENMIRATNEAYSDAARGEPDDDPEPDDDGQYFNASLDAARALIQVRQAVAAHNMANSIVTMANSIVTTAFLRSLEAEAFRLPAVVDGHLIRWSDGDEKRLMVEKLDFVEPAEQ